MICILSETVDLGQICEVGTCRDTSPPPFVKNIICLLVETSSAMMSGIYHSCISFILPFY